LRARLRQYELRDQIDAVRRSERDLADMFENAAVGLHTIDAAGTVTRVNQTELELLGYAREEYVGHDIAEFHADASVIRDMLERLRAEEPIVNREVRMRAKDSTIRHVLVSSNAQREGGVFVR